MVWWHIAHITLHMVEAETCQPSPAQPSQNDDYVPCMPALISTEPTNTTRVVRNNNNNNNNNITHATHARTQHISEIGGLAGQGRGGDEEEEMVEEEEEEDDNTVCLITREGTGKNVCLGKEASKQGPVCCLTLACPVHCSRYGPVARCTHNNNPLCAHASWVFFLKPEMDRKVEC